MLFKDVGWGRPLLCEDAGAPLVSSLELRRGLELEFLASIRFTGTVSTSRSGVFVELVVWP